MSDHHANKASLSRTQGAIIETVRDAEGGRAPIAALVQRARRDDHELDFANLLFDMERDLRSLHSAGFVEFSRVFQESHGVPRDEPVLATELDGVFPLNPMADWEAPPHGLAETDPAGLELRVAFTPEGKRRFGPGPRPDSGRLRAH